MHADLMAAALKRLKNLGYGLKVPPEVRWDLRGLASGQALLQRNTIRLNAELFARESEAFARNTIIHELCHLAVWQRHGRRARPHGAQWQTLMRALGEVPERCHHAIATPVRQQLRFPYRCGCQQHQLTTTRHKRALRGTPYVCRRCRQVLVPEQKLSPVGDIVELEENLST